VWRQDLGGEAPESPNAGCQLLADAFTVRSRPVRHILADGCTEHRLPPFAEPTGTRIVYPKRR
jgi:hypothetical protein